MLAILSIYSFFDKEGAEQAKAKHDMITIREVINNYKLQINKYPASNKGLSSLLSESGEEGYKGPLLKPSLIVDPWGSQYIYENRKNTVVFIGTAGPDHKWESSVEDVLGGNLKGDDRAEIIIAR